MSFKPGAPRHLRLWSRSSNIAEGSIKEQLGTRLWQSGLIRNGMRRIVNQQVGIAIIPEVTTSLIQDMRAL